MAAVVVTFRPPSASPSASPAASRGRAASARAPAGGRSPGLKRRSPPGTPARATFVETHLRAVPMVRDGVCPPNFGLAAPLEGLPPHRPGPAAAAAFRGRPASSRPAGQGRVAAAAARAAALPPTLHTPGQALAFVAGVVAACGLTSTAGLLLLPCDWDDMVPGAAGRQAGGVALLVLAPFFGLAAGAANVWLMEALQAPQGMALPR